MSAYRYPPPMVVLVLVFTLSLLSPASAYIPQQQLSSCINKRPDGRYVCGNNGDGSSTPYARLTKVKTLDACRLECLQNIDAFTTIDPAECGSLVYDSEAQTCHLFEPKYGTRTFRANASSPGVFYHSRCFNCLYPKKPPPPGTNLVIYPGIEVATSSRSPISPWYPNRFYDSSYGLARPGYNSGRALYMQGEYAWLQQTLPNKNVLVFDIRLRYKFEYANSMTTYLQIIAGISDWTIYPQVSAATNNTWYTFQSTFRLDSDYMRSNTTNKLSYLPQDIRLRLHNTGKPFSRVYIDDVVVTPALNQDPQPNPSAANLLTNGGWETGSWEPWNVTRARRSTEKALTFISPGKDGSKYALVYDPNTIDENSGDGLSATISQKVQLKPQARYIASFAFQFGRNSTVCSSANLNENWEFDVSLDDIKGPDSKRTGTRMGSRLDYYNALEPYIGRYIVTSVPLYSFSSSPLTEATFTLTFTGYGDPEYGGSGPECALLIDDISITEMA